MLQPFYKIKSLLSKEKASNHDNRIRLLYIIDSLYNAGAQKVLVNVVNGLASKGYEQKVCCLNDVVSENVVEALTRAGAEVVVIGKMQLLSGAGLIRLFMLIKRWRPHVVQTLLPFADMIGRTVARAAKARSIVTAIHARNIDKSWWQFQLDKWTIPWADKVIFVSKQVIPFSIASEGVRPERVVYIPNGIELITKNETKTLDLRAQFGIASNAKLIGTVGRLNPQKGHCFLIAALPKVLSEFSDIALCLVGDGPLRGELQRQVESLGISDKVYFLGERNDVSEILKSLDLYVQSSLFEGMPLAVMEAMSASCPVVATRVDGTEELIVHGQTGWLVAPSAPNALAEGVLYALKHPDEFAQIAHNARQTIEENFTVDKMVLAYDAVFRQLAESTDRLHE